MITAEIDRKYWPWNRILWPWRKLASDKWWPENHRAQHLWKYPFYLQVLNKSIIYIGEWESETLLVMHFDLLAVNFGHLPRTKTYQLKSIDHFSLDDPWEMGFLFIQYSKLREWPKASLWPSAPETKWKGPGLTKLTFGCIFFRKSVSKNASKLILAPLCEKQSSENAEWRRLSSNVWVKNFTAQNMAYFMFDSEVGNASRIRFFRSFVEDFYHELLALLMKALEIQG